MPEVTALMLPEMTAHPSVYEFMTYPIVLLTNDKTMQMTDMKLIKMLLFLIAANKNDKFIYKISFLLLYQFLTQMASSATASNGF